MRRAGKWKRALAAVLSAVLLAGAAGVLAPSGSVEVQAASLEQPVLGIDVSSYQGDIDWEAVHNAGISFAMVRIGNMAYGLDNKFVQNVLNATQAGIRVGAYVYSYATNATEAAQDANFAVAALQQFPVTFPVALDLEDKSQKDLDKATLEDIANTFCNIIYEAGYTPLVYSYRNWLVDKMRPIPYDHWVAHFTTGATDYPYPYAIWQYSSKGSVPGIAGNVDLDLLYKDYFNMIVANGTVQDGDITYSYSNWKRTNGFRYVNGVRYFYDVNGNRLTNKTWSDGDNNVIRVCNDGHVVVITAEMQVYAQNQEKALQDAQTAYDNAVTAAATAQQQLADAQAQLPALAQQATSDLDNLNNLVAQLTADPSNADLAAQVQAAQQQAVTSNQAVADAQTNIQNLQNTINDVSVKQQALEQQKEETAKAKAAIVVPQ